MTIESSKDEKQCIYIYIKIECATYVFVLVYLLIYLITTFCWFAVGATHEFQNKIGVDYKKPWLTWNNYKRSGMGEKGGKKVELGSGETGSVGNGGEGGAEGEDEQNGGEIKK